MNVRNLEKAVILVSIKNEVNRSPASVRMFAQPML